MKDKVKKNYIYNLIYQIVVIISPLIITPYTARIFEADGIGLNSGINAICSNFLLFAVLGTSTYAVKYIGEIQESVYERSKRFWEIQIFRMISTFITLICYVLFVLNTESQWIQYYLIYSILLGNVAVDITWFFQGIEDFKTVVIRNVLVRITFIILVFIFVKEKNDLALFMLLSCVTTIIGSILMWISLPKYITKMKLKDLHPFANTKSIIILFLPTIATQIYTVFDKTILMAFATTTVENGYYEQAEKIVKMSMTIITSLGVVMMPRIANLYNNNCMAEVKKYLKDTYRFIWMIATPLLCGLCGCASILIPVFLGPGYEKSIILIYLLSPLIIVIGFSNAVTLQYLIPTKNEKTFTCAAILAAAINLTMDLFLIPRFYSVGASIGTVLAESIGFVYVVYFLIENKYFALRDFYEGMSKYIISSLIMLLMIVFIKQFIPTSLFGLFLLIIIGCMIYFLSLIILKDSWIIFLLNRFKFRSK